MATVVHNPAPVVETPPATFTLTLSEHEADVLADLLGGHVIGPIDGPRGVTRAIWAALVEAGAAGGWREYFEGNVTGKRA